MAFFAKNRLIIAIALLAIAGLLLFVFLQTGRKYREAPDTRLTNSRSQKNVESAMETNAPSQRTASASFADTAPIRIENTTPPASTTVSLADIKTCMTK